MERQSKGSREAWRRIVKEAKAHPGGCIAIEEEEELGEHFNKNREAGV